MILNLNPNPNPNVNPNPNLNPNLNLNLVLVLCGEAARVLVQRRAAPPHPTTSRPMSERQYLPSKATVCAAE